MKKIILAIVLSFLFTATIGHAVIPEYITLQGRLSDTNNNPLNGLYDFDLEIYNSASGGTSIWSETQSNVNVTNGIFNILLGNVQTLDDEFDDEYWIEISVESSTLSPRVRLTSSPYAYYAENARYSKNSSFADKAGNVLKCSDCDSKFVNTATDKMTGNLTIDVTKSNNLYGLNVTMYAVPAGTNYGGWFACTGGQSGCKAIYAYAPTGLALHIDGSSRFEDDITIQDGSLSLSGVPNKTMLVISQAAGSYYAAWIRGGAGVKLDNTIIEGDLNVTGNIYYDGSLTNYHMTEANIQLVNQDVKENDVLVISKDYDSSAEISSKKYDTNVFGVAIKDTKIDEEVGVVILGRFPVKVTAENGLIKRGDLITTSSIPGHAMKCKDRVKCIGAVIGKALEPLESETGIINVMISPQ